MSIRYTPLPSHQSGHRIQDDIENEMHAAFDYSEDEDEDNANPESRPLNPAHSSPQQSMPSTPLPGAYDFENVDYDYPPPGSPPRPTAFALPNEHGNSNGLIPTLDSNNRPFQRQNWLQHTASRVLPSTLADRLGLRTSRISGAVGGGTINDGVFANVTAKPSAPVRVQEGVSFPMYQQLDIDAVQGMKLLLCRKILGTKFHHRMPLRRPMPYPPTGIPQSMLRLHLIRLEK